MTVADVKRLGAMSERLAVKMHVQKRGKGMTVRFTGDHWHVAFESACWALLGEIPSRPLPG